MGQPSIIDKLRRELEQEITTERQVVYILAEIRKLLELRDEKATYFALNSHCCWALHTRMDQNGAKRILERFDSAHAAAIANGKPNLQDVPVALQTELQTTMMCAKFRNELEAYLSLHGLPVELTQRDFKWTQFLSLYSEVIEECPLKLADQGIQLQHITAVTVLEIRQLPMTESPNGIVVFGTEWRLTCIDPKQNGSWSMLFALPLTPILTQTS